MSRIHLVFHVIKLMPVPPDPIEGRVARPPPLPDIVEGEERYEVEEVINIQFYYRKLQFLVKWKGYGHEENLWLSERDIDAPDLIVNFYGANSNVLKWISTITFGQMGFRLWNGGHGRRKGHMHQDTVSWRGGDVRGTPAKSCKAHETTLKPLKPLQSLWSHFEPSHTYLVSPHASWVNSSWPDMAPSAI